MGRAAAILALFSALLVVAPPQALAVPPVVSFETAASDTPETGTHTVTSLDVVDPVVSINDVSELETDGPDPVVYTFTISVSPPAVGATSVRVRATEGAVNPASKSEYQDNLNVTVNIPAGAPSATVEVEAYGDNDVELDETFLVVMDQLTGGLVAGDLTGVATVLDDDAVPVGVADFYNVDEGGTLSTIADTGVLANDIDEDDGRLTAVLASGPSSAGNFTLLPDGAFTYVHDGSAGASDTFTYRADDGTDQSAETTVTITLDNVAPAVTAGPDPAAVAEGVPVNISATFADPGVDDNHTATIDWGDGTVENCPAVCGISFNGGSGSVTGSHAYTAAGVYTVMVTVDDGEDTGSDSLTANIQNANLTVAAGNNQSGDEGDTISVNAGFVDADGRGNHSATIDWGDGSPVQTCPGDCTIVDQGDGTGTVTGSHRYTDDGAFSVVVSVSDASGDNGSGGFTANIANVDPVVEIAGRDRVPLPDSSQGGQEGVRLRLRALVDDPGTENFSYQWQILLKGVEVATGSGKKINYTTRDNGTFVVFLTVEDGDGGSGLDSVLIRVSNVAPVIERIDFDATPAIGALTPMDVYFADPGAADTHTVTVDWGDGGSDGKAGTSPRRFSHTYGSAGTRAAEVCVADNNGAVSCESIYVNPGVAFALGSDFNGDGYEDLPIGVPGEDGKGGVSVIYGSASGLTSAGDDIWKQGVDGVAGSGETGDRFGSALAWGDFDLDGFSDLAVAADNEAIGGLNGVGIVHILYGSPSGLTSARDTTFHQNSSGLGGGNQAGDRFGRSLVAGDYNGDGFADLAIGVPYEDVNGVSNAGRVVVMFGSPTGLTTSGDESWDLNQPGVAGKNKAGNLLGSALASGDFDLDGVWDLAIGVPGKKVARKKAAGAVLVMAGSVLGLDATADRLWHQESGSVADSAERGDRFGSVLATGDFNGDDRADLAIGIPHEGVAGVAQAGAVAVILGGSNGLRSAGNSLWHEGVAGVLGEPAVKDRFGFSVEAGDFNGDGRDDLAIGIPYQEIGRKKNAGDVAILLGSGIGPTASGNQRWNENRKGIKGKSQKNDHLGWALRAFNYDNDGDSDLAIGIPDQNINGKGNAGAVLVLRGRVGGMNAGGDTYWHQDTTGIRESTAPNDRFGKAL